MECGRLLAKAPLAQWPQLVASKLRAARDLVATEGADARTVTSYQRHRLTNATWQAVSGYEPKALPGGLLHIIASQRRLAPTTVDTRRMWLELAGAQGQMLTLEAEDSGQLFVQPHVGKLAGLITAYVESQLA